MILTQVVPKIKVDKLISERAISILIISVISMLLAQFMKFVIVSIKEKRWAFDAMFSTGGFPSSHTSFCITMCFTLGLFQMTDLGYFDWSFPVAVVLSSIVIHDAMGLRFEASKHAKILNKLGENMTEEERKEVGFGKKGKLKELLGHKGREVIGGAILGIIIAYIGYFIVINAWPAPFEPGTYEPDTETTTSIIKCLFNFI